MGQINLTNPIFNDEDMARLYLESIRWPQGPVCPKCGSTAKHYALQPKEGFKEHARKGVWKCKECRKQFSVTVGTVFERSHIPLNKWLLATFLMNASKKGMSSHQMHRMLQVTYKTAWFMTQRIRFAMKTIFPTDEKFSGVVEADETYVGGKGRGKRGRGSVKKTPVFSLVERNGRVMSTPVGRVTGANLKSIIRQNVDRSTIIMTDDFSSYNGLGRDFAEHHVINHSAKEYVRGNVHTNTIEGYFSLLKRGIIGTYHHVSKHHLHRYLSEFDFRYNRRTFDDTERSIAALMSIEGKRLQYRDS